MSVLDSILTTLDPTNGYNTTPKAKSSNKSKKPNKPAKPKDNANKAKVENNIIEKPKIETTISVQKDLPMDNLITSISSDNIVQGILWSEILGKPVSKRRGRW